MTLTPSKLLILCKVPLHQVGFAGLHTADGIGGTGAGDGALVTINAEVVHDLQVQRSVPEGSTSLDAFSAADAQIFVYYILEIGFFDEFAADGGSRTELIFAGGAECVAVGFKISSAEVAVTAKVKCVHTFDCRGCQDTLCGASSALGAFKGVDLPHPFFLEIPAAANPAMPPIASAREIRAPPRMNSRLDLILSFSMTALLQITRG